MQHPNASLPRCRVLRGSFLLFLGLLPSLMSAPRPGSAAGLDQTSASFLVDSTLDEPDADSADGACISVPSSVCTLRAAIQQANALEGHEVISFSVPAPATFLLTHAGEDDVAATGDLDITGNLSLVSSSAANVIVDGNMSVTNDRVFSVFPGALVAITGMTIRNGGGLAGSGLPGGGILNYGVLQLTDVQVSDNSAQSGGGIYNYGTANLTNSTVNGNTAADLGGGIANYATAVIKGSTVSGNTAQYGGGVRNSGTLILDERSMVSGNTATLDGGGIFDNSTGEATLTLIDTTVSDNEAARDGGGIFNGGSARLSVTGSLVTENTAKNDASPTAGGGGIFNNGPATLTDSTVSHNRAVRNGGGIFQLGTTTLTLNGSTVHSNSAEGEGGGGVYNRGTVMLSNTAVTENKAVNTNGYGGGIFNNLGCTVTLTHGSSVSGNYASSGAGIFDFGGRFILSDTTVAGNSSSGFGGGIYNSSRGGTGTLSNSTVSGNTTGSVGGGIYNSATLILHNSTVSSNSARGEGGGMYNFNNLHLFNTTVALNVADSDNNGTESGGGIFNNVGSFATVNLRNSLIAANMNLEPGGRYPLAVADDCKGELNVEDYNLIETTTGCSLTGMARGNIYAISPMLGPLADNGGATFTHALLVGSPAVDAANPAGCKDLEDVELATDQRGGARPFGPRCDMGAFEFGAFVATTTPTDSPTATETATATGTTAPTATATTTHLPTGSPTTTATYDPGASPTSTPTGTPTTDPTRASTATDTAPPNARLYLPRTLRP